MIITNTGEATRLIISWILIGVVRSLVESGHQTLAIIFSAIGAILFLYGEVRIEWIRLSRHKNDNLIQTLTGEKPKLHSNLLRTVTMSMRISAAVSLTYSLLGGKVDGTVGTLILLLSLQAYIMTQERDALLISKNRLYKIRKQKDIQIDKIYEK